MRRSAAVIIREHLITERAAERRQSSGSTGLRCYASEALVCARAIGFRLAHAAADGHINLDGQLDEDAAVGELDVRTAITFRIGDDVHKFVLAALKREYPDLQDEQVWALQGVSGRSDGVYTQGGERTLVEIKSTSNRSVGAVLKSGGPLPHHLAQAGLGALALRCSLLHVIYVNKTPYENDSAVADFLLPFNPLTARAELKRMQSITKTVAGGNLPIPMTAAGRFITDPISDPDCVYCPHKLQCSMVGPKNVPLSAIVRYQSVG